MKDLTEVMSKIDAYRDAIYDGSKWRGNDGNSLSIAIVDLAALNSYLGEAVADAERDANMSEANYKATREGRKLELIKGEDKISATQAESQAYVDCTNELELWNQFQYQYRLLSLKRNDTNNLVDACRSRLSYLKQELEKS